MIGFDSRTALDDGAEAECIAVGAGRSRGRAADSDGRGNQSSRSLVSSSFVSLQRAQAAVALLALVFFEEMS